MFGDVITYEEDKNYFVTHRIVSKNDDTLITKGDRNNEVDTEISNSKILGKVVFHSLWLGNFIRIYLKYIFIGFTVFIIFINIYWNYKENRKSEIEEKNEKNENKTIE